MYVQINQFAPDLTTDTPGIILDCSQMVPSRNGGYEAAPDAIDVGMAALESKVFSAVSLTRLDNTARTFAALQTKLFERSGLTWLDRTKAGGYTGGGNSLWRFAQYGDISLATNKIDPIQKSDSSTFSDLGGSPPKAAFIDTILGFVVVANTNEAIHGDSVDRWWCSGIRNHETWAASVATQAATARLFEPAGPITASKRLGDNWIIYKQRGIYLGTYVGPPFIWDFRLVSDTIGALSHEGVIDIGVAHIFIGFDDIWMFDGSRPQSIAGPIKEWFVDRTRTKTPLKISNVWDRRNSIIYFYFSSSNSTGEIDECIVFNTDTRKWGRANRAVRVAFENIDPGVTYDDVGTRISTYESVIDGTTYDNFLSSGVSYPIPAVFSSADDKLKTLTGEPGLSSLTLWDLGDDISNITLQRLRPRFSIEPATASLKHKARDSLGAPLGPETMVLFTDCRFDLVTTGRWHRNELNFTGSTALHGVDIEARSGGRW